LLAPVVATWTIAGVSTAAVIVRPWRVPEAVWAVAGAAALVGFGLLSPAAARAAIGRGGDVYLFLGGMMLLAELARREGLFDWLATHALRVAGGSGRRLLALVYGIGVLVTVFMSNDATAVVLTPAVYAAARASGARPLPHLFACALVANAASFVLPISNPANLVVFGDRMPALGEWLASFLLPSLVAIAATYAALRWLFRAELAVPIAHEAEAPPLTPSGRIAAAALAGVGAVLLLASALHLPLGALTLGASTLAAVLVLARERATPWPLLKAVSWDVLALVAGLFVLVGGLEATGLIARLAQALDQAAAAWGAAAPLVTGGLVALACNLMNNLPAGLIAGSVSGDPHVGEAVRGAIAVAVDLGPNLSVTGSLATILWLAALRREGEHVTAWQFLKVGAVAMPAALLPALAMVAWVG
jgi:arsenical pump membrane protein